MSANKRPSTSSLRRYLTSRPYLSVADIRRRFGLDPDAMSVVSRNGTTAYVGMPEREASKLQDLWQRDEVGVELSVEVKAPVVVGVYPMRIARFVLDQANAASGDGYAPSPAPPRQTQANGDAFGTPHRPMPDGRPVVASHEDAAGE
jgi:hypothetical protein